MPLRQPLRRAHPLTPCPKQPLRNRISQYPSGIATTPRDAITHTTLVSAAKIVLAIIADRAPMRKRPRGKGAVVTLRIAAAWWPIV